MVRVNLLGWPCSQSQNAVPFFVGNQLVTYIVKVELLLLLCAHAKIFIFSFESLHKKRKF